MRIGLAAPRSVDAGARQTVRRRNDRARDRLPDQPPEVYLCSGVHVGSSLRFLMSRAFQWHLGFGDSSHPQPEFSAPELGRRRRRNCRRSCLARSNVGHFLMRPHSCVALRRSGAGQFACNGGVWRCRSRGRHQHNPGCINRPANRPTGLLIDGASAVRPSHRRVRAGPLEDRQVAR